MTTKQRKKYTIDDLRAWYMDNQHDLDSLRTLHALLDKVTDKLSKTPAAAEEASKFKQLKILVRNRINTMEAEKCARAERDQDLGAQLLAR